MKTPKILIWALLFIFTSCERVLIKKDLASENPYDNFEYLWQQCDQKYSYFDLKKINWNSIHDIYYAKLFEDMSDDSLFNVLGNMLTELRDDHTNLISKFNVSYYGVDNRGPDNFNWKTVEETYLPSDYYVTGPFRHDFVNGTNQEVGYIRYSIFTGTANTYNLDFVLEKYKDTKGIILDIRENGGGVIMDVFDILSRFVDKKTLVYYNRIKDGTDHNDFSAPEPVYVEPSDDINYTKKIILLTDRGTYSAASFTSLGAKAIENIVLVGDTTGGGLGLPNGGQLPIGWTYRFSITQALNLDHDESYENGVPPDFRVLFDWNDLSKDEVIEFAIQQVLQ